MGELVQADIFTLIFLNCQLCAELNINALLYWFLNTSPTACHRDLISLENLKFNLSCGFHVNSIFYCNNKNRDKFRCTRYHVILGR
jgi:hypothetical protein